MAGIAAKGRVDADLQRVKALNISSTPSIFINGIPVQPSDMKVEPLKRLIDGELQKAVAQNQPANASGVPPAANAGNASK